MLGVCGGVGRPAFPLCPACARPLFQLLGDVFTACEARSGPSRRAMSRPRLVLASAPPRSHGARLQDVDDGREVAWANMGTDTDVKAKSPRDTSNRTSSSLWKMCGGSRR